MRNISLILLVMLVIASCVNERIEDGTNVLDNSALKGKYTFGKKSIKGLLSWWKGDGDAEDFQNGNDGYLVNGTTFEEGIVNEAFSFTWEGRQVVDENNDPIEEGQANYVEAPFGPEIGLIQEFTMEMWIKLFSDELAEDGKFERFMTIVCNTSEGLHAKCCVRHNGLGRLSFYMFFDDDDEDPYNNYQEVNAIVLTTGVFHHVAATYDSNSMKLYCDGELVGEPTEWTAEVKSSEEGFVLLSSIDEPIWGLIDEACIFNRALTTQEIKEIYDSGMWFNEKIKK